MPATRMLMPPRKEFPAAESWLVLLLPAKELNQKCNLRFETSMKLPLFITLCLDSSPAATAALTLKEIRTASRTDDRNDP